MDVLDDYLLYSNEKLMTIIRIQRNMDKGVRQYLSSVKYAPIGDFSKGLEWFNVSEPLSFENHLKGKIVILDFFTYCCINCMHTIPDLREIENKYSVEDGLVVIGVHSAKFENEKQSSNILSAVQRYNIGHPVVNDHNSEMWKNCDVQCWPTLLILGPNANPILMLTGEGHKNYLLDCMETMLDYYRQLGCISDHKLPIKSAFHLLPDLKGPLLFPGKITSFSDKNGHNILAVSDTGNNRILIIDDQGTILQVVGGKKLGFKDGDLENAEFNNPQGLAFQSSKVLFVADTENHAIRRVDLEERKVETVAGDGKQGHDMKGGCLGSSQPISSPWDLCVFRTPDMDLTFHPDGNPPVRDVLIIAMAGVHQIWALFLEDTVWWKCKKYPKGTCIRIAGSGREENRNNNYPQTAAFAQPSGLALCEKNKEVYIADSESSSIRRMSLIDGKVSPVVGGDRNPQNLFAFGDIDGSLYDAKLQHALGVAMSPDGKTLFVADTYNHKLKKVDITEDTVTTLQISTTANDSSAAFNEPAGLCVSPDGKKIYVADTNNHQIKIVTLGRNTIISRIERLDLSSEETSELATSSSNIVPLPKPLELSNKGGKIVLKFNLKFINGLKLTEGAPQRWVVELPNATYSCVPKNGINTKNLELILSVPPKKDSDSSVNINFSLMTCTDESCLPKEFTVRIQLEFSENADVKVDTDINVYLDVNNIQIGS